MTKNRLDRQGHTQCTVIEIDRDKRKKYRWRVIARNGRILGASSQGYKRKKAMLRNIDDMARALGATIVDARFTQPYPETRFVIIDRTANG